MSKPRLLFLTSRFPFPLEKGDKLRAYHFIRTLSPHFEIGLFALNNRPVAPAQIAALEPFCSRIETQVIRPYRSLLQLAAAGRLPFQAAWFYNEQCMSALKAFCAEFQPQAMFCHLLRMAEYARRLSVHPSLIDYMDTFSKGMERMASNGSLPVRWPAHIESKRLKQYERDIFDLFDEKIIISAQDRDCIPHPERDSIKVVPNGVDMDFFRPLQTNEKPEFELMFNGNMAYPPNIASAVFAAREIMPLLQTGTDNIRLLIAGPNPSPRVRALAGPQVTVSGWLDDIRDAYTKTRIMIAPMLISIGLQNKILQAMAMKVPCIVSTMANNALGAIPGEHLLVADTPTEWRDSIHRLLNDPALYDRLRESAFTFVKDRFNWERHAGSIAKLLR